MMNILNENWLILDLETTGLNPKTDRVIEIAAIRLGADESRREYETLVNPGMKIPLAISQLTGITPEMTQPAPGLKEAAGPLLELMEGCLIVAHNASFDAEFLIQGLSLDIPGSRIVDTLEFAKILFPKLSSYSLRSLIGYFGLETAPSHRASQDTLALERLFVHLIRTAEALPGRIVTVIAQCLGNQEGLGRIFQKIAVSSLSRSRGGRAAAAFAGEAGFLETGALLDQSGLEDSEDSDEDPAFVWDTARLEALFQPEGAFAGGMALYQKRPQQIEMFKAVVKAFEASSHLIVEAGTGVGKSLAYLTPALAWAVSRQERVAAATHTIALQEQLLNSDIGFLRAHLPFPFKVAVLKGRGNYLCLSQWEALQDRAADLIWGERVFLARLAYWIRSGGSGDLDHINLLSAEREWFFQIASSRDTCQSSQCLHYRSCFYQKARQEANAADLIIVNHSLLLSDIRMEGNLLPKYDYLIIDEAHHMEEEATKQFTETFSSKEFVKKVQLLHKRRDAFGRPGMIVYLRQYAAQWPDKFQRLTQLLGNLEAAVQMVLSRGDEIQKLLYRQTVPETVRITDQILDAPWWQEMSLVFDNLRTQCVDLDRILAELTETLTEDEGKNLDESYVKGRLTLFEQIQTDIRVLNLFFDRSERSDRTEADGKICYVYWLEQSPRKNELLLHRTPADVSSYFQKYLFSPKASVIMTSATLSVDGSFGYFMSQVGLTPEETDTLLLHSPFLYREQSLLLVDSSLPDPAQTGEALFSMALTEAMEKILAVSGGRTLVLFTSHRQLRVVYEALYEKFRGKGLELFADGVNGSRKSLLEELKRNDNAVVFGANTFWEGVDLPGLALTSLIIARLPFWPPGMPLVEAKIESLAQEGKDGFSHYSLPQAVIRFKQGYGRLIRSIDDWGVVVVLDNRIVKKRYGRTFLQSLPDSRRLTGDTLFVTDQMAKWRRQFV
jgi:ATP-dependent DNA helicase DinG